MGKSWVLVVEDDPELRAVVAEILEWEGYRVTTASNGRKALQAIEETSTGGATSPALVLLDMWMPVLDGWSVARELKQRAIKVPIVVMTAAEDAPRSAEEVDADGYLAKPFGMDDLLEAIRPHMRC